jgi:hypothetical protein
MNPSIPWENRLRRWIPRRPASALKTQIFDPVNATSTAPALTRVPLWWTPALAGSLLVMVLLTTWTGGGYFHHPPAVAGLWGSTGWSNQDLACYATATLHSDRNALPAPIIRWTNGGVFPSSRASFLLLGTNGQMR